MRRRLLFLLLAALVSGSLHAQITETALLDTVQYTAFRFFWDEANPSNGLIRDRATIGSSSYIALVPSSIASCGFGLSAICIGVDHGWVPRATAADRVVTMLRTFWNGPQGSGSNYIGAYGLFYHMLDMTTAKRTWNSELSTIDTALLFAGIVDAREFFDGTDGTETEIRALADAITQRANWDLLRNYNPGILMGWMPGSGFLNYSQWVGYNEAMIMYILAMGSPTYPVDSLGWSAWTQGYNWQSQYGQTYINFPPLFGHQYSHCWIDFRNVQDAYMREKGITYFENSRRAALAQRAYCAANPGGFTGYSDSLWGITASDTPAGYRAHGAPPAQDDDGTLVPTAPIASIAFAPEAVLPTIRNMWNNYRSQLWTKYGFRDAFNLKVNWWDTDIIGIDQGPMIIMIENYRTGKVWKRFMKNADIQRGLAVAGFTTVTDVVDATPLVPQNVTLGQNYPNPFNPSTTITFSLPQGNATRVSLLVFDVLGRTVAVLIDGVLDGGNHAITLDGSRLSSGTYFYQLRTAGATLTRSLVLSK
jgi:hypothetical protein